MTYPHSQETTSDAIRTLTNRITYLRNERDSLLVGSAKLLAYGITSHTTDVATRLRAINTEARDISHDLDTLGAHQAAEDAVACQTLIIWPNS